MRWPFSSMIVFVRLFLRTNSTASSSMSGIGTVIRRLSINLSLSLPECSENQGRILLCGLSYTGIQKNATIVTADINTASTDFSCTTSKYEFHKSVPFRKTSLMISEISRNHNDPDSGALDWQMVSYDADCALKLTILLNWAKTKLTILWYGFWKDEEYAEKGIRRFPFECYSVSANCELYSWA